MAAPVLAAGPDTMAVFAIGPNYEGTWATGVVPGEITGSNAVSRVAHPAGPRHADVLPADHPPAPPADLNALDPAIWPRGARRVDGVLTIGGIDVRDLAGQFGTPLFVMDEEDFRGRCRDFTQAFGDQAA